MKKGCLVFFLVCSSFAVASPLEDFVGVLEKVCGLNVPPALLDKIGGEQSQQVLCAVKDLATRAETLAGAAGDGLESFLREGFREGFDLLEQYTDLDTDLAAIETFASEFEGLLKQGVTLEGAYAFVTRSAGVQKIKALLAASTAKDGSLERAVEESSRLNPVVLAAELDTIRNTAALQTRKGKVLDVSADAMSQALSSVMRGDEQDLISNVTNPNPVDITKKGIADVAAERAEQAVSSRAAIQALLNLNGDSLRQRQLETTSLLTVLKEGQVQTARTVQQLGYVVTELYDQRIREENSWRAEQRRTTEEAFAGAKTMGESVRSVGVVLDVVANELGAKKK